MPFFMDLHRGKEGRTLADIEEAHLRDVEAQGRYGVNYISFFHDEASGAVYCVAEAPDADACVAVHVEAIGDPPDAIIPVEPVLLDKFFGGQPPSQTGVMLRPGGEPDPGVRTVMFTDIVDSTRLTDELGDATGVKLVRVHDRIVQDRLASSDGSMVKHTGDGLMAAFVSCDDAVTCAIGVQEDLSSYRSGDHALPLEVRIGLHVGEPVAAHGDLFGLAVNIARRICDAGGPGEILVSAAVRDQLAATVAIDALGPHEFKGVSRPIEVHRVHWGR
ncbi:MAG: DUF4242 domain-containing protein [Nitriliruptorales bacterium]|nr:DUF4242 domain-containing protein [Nitriliruptorales bacterium]